MYMPWLCKKALVGNIPQTNSLSDIVFLMKHILSDTGGSNHLEILTDAKQKRCSRSFKAYSFQWIKLKNRRNGGNCSKLQE